MFTCYRHLMNRIETHWLRCFQEILIGGRCRPVTFYRLSLGAHGMGAPWATSSNEAWVHDLPPFEGKASPLSSPSSSSASAKGPFSAYLADKLVLQTLSEVTSSYSTRVNLIFMVSGLVNLDVERVVSWRMTFSPRGRRYIDVCADTSIAVAAMTSLSILLCRFDIMTISYRTST